MHQAAAETIALRALAWLAGNEALLPVFLGATGASLAELKSRAAEPDFLGSVLDFLLLDDAWVIAFAAEHGLPPASLQAARAALPGGAAINWT